MKNFIIFFAFIHISLNIFSQEKINLVSEFSSTLSDELGILSNTGSQGYFNVGLNLGIDYEFDKGNFYILLDYEYSSNVFAYSEPSTAGELKYVSFNSLLRSHVIGVSLKYTFLKNENNFRPFLKISGLTEVSTNYKNGYLLDEGFIPRSESGASYIYPPYPEGPEVNYYNSFLYNSTPLISRILGGVDVKLSQNISLNIAAGYSFRIMKTKYASWYENEDINVVAQDKPTKNIRSQMVDFQLGLTYAFSLKKKSEKTKN